MSLNFTGDLVTSCQCVVDVRESRGKGLGLFASNPFFEAQEIVRNHIIPLPVSLEKLGLGRLYDHEFYWPQADGADGCCLVMGPITFVNHSSNPNCSLRQLTGENMMALVALRTIAAGEELTFDYDCPLWFDEDS